MAKIQLSNKPTVSELATNDSLVVVQANGNVRRIPRGNSGFLNTWTGTLEEYNAMGSHDAGTVYYITGDTDNG